MRVRDLEDYIEAFRQVIEATWEPVSSVDPQPSHVYNGLTAAMGDWQQIQWEVLVEGNLRHTNQLEGYLVFYGEGMDDGLSMRYSEPNALATHEVCCIPREGGMSLTEVIGGCSISFPERGLPVGEFVSLSQQPWYARKPPFDYVLTRNPPDDLALVFDRQQVRFVLRELDCTSQTGSGS